MRTSSYAPAAAGACPGGSKCARMNSSRRPRPRELIGVLDEALDEPHPPRDRVRIQVAAQLLITPTLEHLLDSLGLRMQHRNRTDHIHATALIDGQNGLQACLIRCIIESSSESAAGGGITFDASRPGVSAARRERTPSEPPQVTPNPQINKSFRHQTRVATNLRRHRIRDSSDETEELWLRRCAVHRARGPRVGRH